MASGAVRACGTEIAIDRLQRWKKQMSTKATKARRGGLKIV